MQALKEAALFGSEFLLRFCCFCPWDPELTGLAQPRTPLGSVVPTVPDGLYDSDGSIRNPRVYARANKETAGIFLATFGSSRLS